MDSNVYIENTYSDIYSYFGATEEVAEVAPFTGINTNNVYRCVWGRLCLQQVCVVCSDVVVGVLIVVGVCPCVCGCVCVFFYRQTTAV